MKNLKKELKDLGLTKKGAVQIHASKKHPIFNLLPDEEKTYGHVYMWVVEVNSQPLEIIYIGKAGKTLKKRCDQHVGGFKGGHKKGIKNAERIKSILAKGGKSIAIYSRFSQQKKIFNQDNISLCDAEEQALILTYQEVYDLLNKKLK